MLRFALLLIVLCAPVMGQSTPANCPTISVSGPAGIVPSGATISFTATVRSSDVGLAPLFHWDISGGELVKGQGTREIEVKFLGRTVVASLEILGLPSGCPSSAGETFPSGQPQETAVKIAELVTGESLLIKNEINRIKSEMKAFPADRLYILIGIQNGWSGSDAESVEKRLIDALSGPSGRELIHDARITMVSCGNKDLPATIWRVPPGADNPDCNSAITYMSQPGAKPIEPECPEITVTGPAGVMRPGQHLIFTANTNYSKRDELVFRWMTTGGKIVEGQGTQSIIVATSDADNWTNITALLSVIGLDESCKATAEETARLEGGGQPITLSEFGPLSPEKLRLRLDRLVPTFKEHPDSVLYIVVNPAASDSTKQIEEYKNLVRKHLETKHRIASSQIVFAKLNEMQTRSTKIYLIPSVATRP